MRSGLRYQFLPLVAALALLVAAMPSAQAVELEFTLDESQTTLTLTEIFLETLGVNLEPQEAGVSDISSLTGTQLVEVDDAANPTAISFVSGNMLMSDNGDWLPDFLGGENGNPGTPQPGAYGSQFVDPGFGVEFYSVFRESVLGLTMYDENHFGDPIVPDPIPITGGSFPWDDENSRVMVDVIGGSWDWNLAGAFGEDHNGGWDPDDEDFGEPVDGADNLNVPTTNGTYAVVGNIATLTIPFSSRLGEDPTGDPSDLLAVFDGVIVMTADISIVPIGGDFDNNGIVDGNDFLIWQSGFGAPGDHSMGDADMNGIVDGNDFLIWQAQFGGPPSGGGSGAVPEPASLAILAVMAFAVAAMRKRLG